MQSSTSDVIPGYLIVLNQFIFFTCLTFPYGLQPAKSGHANQELLTSTKVLVKYFWN